VKDCFREDRDGGFIPDFHAPLGIYAGLVASASGTTVNVAGRIEGSDLGTTWRGAVVTIMEGKGAGQFRFLKNADAGDAGGGKVEVDRPWDVVPDSSSFITVSKCLLHALVVGVEMCSRYVDRRDVNTAIYLSDGAGAIVLGRRSTDEGIRASAFFTDSSNYESVRMRGGGSSHPLAGRQYDPAIDTMEMNGIATWKQAITHLPTVMRRCAQKAGVAMSEVDFLVFHQANLRLIEYIVRKMGLGLDRTYTNVQEIGNTGSASLAIALSEAVHKGLIRPGSLVMLAAVGAGFNFGASLWRWHLDLGGPRP
jgi:hypothetical protein